MQEIPYRKDRKPIGSATGTNIYDEDYRLLEMRVRRMDTGLAWFEAPKSTARRPVTNIDADKYPHVFI